MRVQECRAAPPRSEAGGETRLMVEFVAPEPPALPRATPGRRRCRSASSTTSIWGRGRRWRTSTSSACACWSTPTRRATTATIWPSTTARRSVWCPRPTCSSPPRRSARAASGIGTLVYLLPFYNPLRLIDEICMVDQLSRGRLEIGLGRGIQPWECQVYNIDPQDTRTLFRESLDVLLMGLATRGELRRRTPHLPQCAGHDASVPAALPATVVSHQRA